MGIFGEAWQNVGDLFRKGERVRIIDERGHEVEVFIESKPLQNPWHLIRLLTFKNWIFFLVGLAAWTVDGYDFHSVSLSVVNLSAYYGVSKVDITTAITLTLLFRSIGAAVFGLAGDYYGRKWPMSINMLIIGAFQLATAYAPTYASFLVIRACFGIGMGGIWGCAIAMALESCPIEARGLMSGILQQGYSLGYLFAAVFNLSIANTGPDGYKQLFYIGAGASFFIGIVRMFFPESEQFLKAKAEGKRGEHTKKFMSELGVVCKTEWRKMIYATILMSWFNYFSHTTQDSYPTFLQVGKGFTQYYADRGTVIAKVGAVVGGAFVGYVSQSFGRRRSIVIAALLALCLIPAWVLPETAEGLAAASFFLQFMVQGAWGVIPVHLNEISPPAFRASFPGIAYQLGNMISSPAAQMVTGLAAQYRTYSNGKWVDGFGPVMGVATAIIALGVAVWTAVGKESLGTHFEYAVAGVGIVVTGQPASDVESGPRESESIDEKKEHISEEPQMSQPAVAAEPHVSPKDEVAPEIAHIEKA